MISKTTPPEPRTNIELGDLNLLQQVASKHLTFSLTLACPLQCAHCIVDAGPDKGYTTMPVNIAEYYAAQLPDMYELGIRSVSFTGGEPLLAKKQLKVLSDSAVAGGILCGVVTASHWAVSETIAEKVIGEFSSIQIWDLSIDSYHQNYVQLDRVRYAYCAAKKLLKKVSLRFTYHDPLSGEDENLMEYINSFAEEGDVCSQRIRNVGRAENLQLQKSQKYIPWNKPCLTQGMVIRYDGSIAPCCLNLVEKRNHIFQFGDARAKPLKEIYREYFSHPVLQMIRTIGFVDIMNWIFEAGLDGLLNEELPDDVCDLCPMLVTNKVIGKLIDQKASQITNRMRIAILSNKIFDENIMLESLVAELKADEQLAEDVSKSDLALLESIIPIESIIPT